MENENQDKTPQHDAEAREQPALSPEMAENVKQLVKDLLEEQLADTRIEAYRQGLNERIDAIVLTEASCLVLRYPKAHMRIIKQ